MILELRALYLKKIALTTNIERSIITHLPTLINAVKNDELRQALSGHLEETKEHYAAMRNIMSLHEEESEEPTVTSFEVLMAETGETLELLTDDAAIDAFVIASADLVEHIEMSHYETLVQWAKHLEEKDAEKVFTTILSEEKQAANKVASIGAGSFLWGGVIAEAAKEETKDPALAL